jgi:hypothetical protein
MRICSTVISKIYCFGSEHSLAYCNEFGMSPITADLNLINRTNCFELSCKLKTAFSGEMSVYLLYSISKEYNLEITTKKTKVFSFVGTDHLRTKRSEDVV